MNLLATAATPPPQPLPTSAGLPPSLPTSQLPMSVGGGISSRFPVKAVIGGVLGAGLGFLLLGPLGAVAGGALGAFLGSRMGAHSPRQS